MILNSNKVYSGESVNKSNDIPNSKNNEDFHLSENTIEIINSKSSDLFSDRYLTYFIDGTNERKLNDNKYN